VASSYRRLPRALSNERGQVLILTTLGMVAFLGIAALAVDLGSWYVGHAEAQRAAEAGAHAGAGTFMTAFMDAAVAEDAAEQFAEDNTVRGVSPDIIPDEDIEVDLANQIVRVHVERSSERGDPLAVYFARALGIYSVDVEASAAAQIWPGGGVSCPLPVMVPDRWSEGPGLNWPRAVDKFGDDPGDFYIPWTEDADASTGYDPVDDWGTEIQIYSGDPQEAPQPSWWHPFAQTGGQGANLLRDGIIGCVDGFTNNAYWIGDRVFTEPGNQPGPLQQGFIDLINSQELIWNRGANGGHGCPTAPDSMLCVTSSPRIRPLPMYDPRDPPANGRKQLTIQNFMGVFVNRVQGGGANTRVTVNFMYYSQGIPAQEWSADGSGVRVLRIIE
jgi:hypothetical protein